MTSQGRAVRIARGLRGLSQSDVAARSGVVPSYISRIESGERLPKPDVFSAIASALGLTAAELALLAAPPESSGSRERAVGLILWRLFREGEDDRAA